MSLNDREPNEGDMPSREVHIEKLAHDLRNDLSYFSEESFPVLRCVTNYFKGEDSETLSKYFQEDSWESEFTYNRDDFGEGNILDVLKNLYAQKDFSSVDRVFSRVIMIEMADMEKGTGLSWSQLSSVALAISMECLKYREWICIQRIEQLKNQLSSIPLKEIALLKFISSQIVEDIASLQLLFHNRNLAEQELVSSLEAQKLLEDLDFGFLTTGDDKVEGLLDELDFDSL